MLPIYLIKARSIVAKVLHFNAVFFFFFFLTDWLLSCTGCRGECHSLHLTAHLSVWSDALSTFFIGSSSLCHSTNGDIGNYFHCSKFYGPWSIAIDMIIMLSGLQWISAHLNIELSNENKILYFSKANLMECLAMV